jgi:intracellular sulfur oxidation DsrE/DsrF family protein
MTDKSAFDDTVIMITREGMGHAEPILQQKLLDTYLRLLLEDGALPAVICFYTDGVKLIVEGSPHLERLSQIERAGVRLIICSTCLDYFGLTEKVRVGIVGGMPDIIAAQARAAKVINL